MSSQGVTRRDILKTRAVGAVGGSVLQVIPAKAAEFVHQVVRKEKAASTAGKYTPKYFSAHQYEMVNWLCDAIIPKDDHSGGAVEAGAPEFIDLLTSENEHYQLRLGGGLVWLHKFFAGCLREIVFVMTPAATQQKARPDCLPQKSPRRTVTQPSE